MSPEYWDKCQIINDLTLVYLSKSQIAIDKSALIFMLHKLQGAWSVWIGLMENYLVQKLLPVV